MVLKSAPVLEASDGHVTGSFPLGSIFPKMVSATAAPASVLPW